MLYNVSNRKHDYLMISNNFLQHIFVDYVCTYIIPSIGTIAIEMLILQKYTFAIPKNPENKNTVLLLNLITK